MAAVSPLASDARDAAHGLGDPGADPGRTDVAALDSLTLQFADPHIERAFRADWNRRSVSQVRIATVLGIVMYAGFGLVDLVVEPDRIAFSWAVRVAVMLYALVMLVAVRHERVVEHLQVAIWTLGVIGGLGIVAIIAVADDVGRAYYGPGMLLITAYLGVFTRLRFIAAALAIAIVVAVYLVAIVLGGHLSAVANLNTLAFLASIAVVSLAGAYAFERTSRLDFARQRVVASQAAHLAEALANVHELRGLIPICAWCKRIRDDDGYWRQLEAYLSDHSRAQFSHGMCPDCYRAHETPGAATP